jgi:hypothetical protein
MMKLLFTLKSPDHSGLEALHRLVLQGLESQVSDIQVLADQILASSESLISSGQLRKELLTISIHKVKSTEWNTLMVRYLESPCRYQAEIKKEKPQTTLFS